MSNLTGPVGSLVLGELSLLAGCLVYTGWWSIVFRPGSKSTWTSGWAGVLFFFLCAFCLGGIVLLVRGISQLPLPASWPGMGVLTALAVAAYIVLLLVTAGLFHRPVTTELVLITAWCFMEVLVVGVLTGGGILSAGRQIFCYVMIAVAVVFSLAVYLAYYHLEPHRAFIAGALPLIADGLASLCIALAVIL